MPRALWSGSLSFGLVNVPVAMFSAVRDTGLHFNQLHAKDAARIETRRYCAEEDKEVRYDEIATAYDMEDGRTVVLTDEDLDAVAPRKTRTIDIEAFVDLAEIDPIYFDHPYFLAPTGESEGPRRAYQLLVETMAQAGKVAIGRFVMRTKEYLVAIQVREGRLSLTTMLLGRRGAVDRRHPDGRQEARQGRDRPGGRPDRGARHRVGPDAHKDEYRARLENVIDRKRKGKKISAPKPEKAPSPVPDLMAALEKSLAEAKGGGGKSAKTKPAGKQDDLAALSRDELYERAQEEDIPGRSSMSKDELVDALSG